MALALINERLRGNSNDELNFLISNNSKKKRNLSIPPIGAAVYVRVFIVEFSVSDPEFATKSFNRFMAHCAIEILQLNHSNLAFEIYVSPNITGCIFMDGEQNHFTEKN